MVAALERNHPCDTIRNVDLRHLGGKFSVKIRRVGQRKDHEPVPRVLGEGTVEDARIDNSIGDNHCVHVTGPRHPYCDMCRSGRNLGNVAPD